MNYSKVFVILMTIALLVMGYISTTDGVDFPFPNLF